MKRTSTQTPTSGTPPISFAAAAAQRNNKANPSTPSAPSQPQAVAANPSPSQPAASQTQPSTAPTSSPGSHGAANSNSTASQKQQPASKPATPSSANGNYSAIAAKGNNAANKKQQGTPAAQGVKTQASAWSTPSTGSAATPASGSPAIRFGSFDGQDSGSTPAGTEQETPASAVSTPVTFGSINASQAPKEEAAVAPAPVTVPQEPAQPVVHTPEHHGFKPAAQHNPHVPHSQPPHLAHNHHNSHRRTDSSSGHNDYRGGQVPIPQVPMMPMGVPQSGPGTYPHQRPPKGHNNMGSMNSQVPHHMHQQHMQQQWAPQYYQYDPSGYYPPQHIYTAPQMGGYIQPPHSRPMRPQYNVNAVSFTPQQPQTLPPPQASKRIAIRHPDTLEEIAVGSTPAPSAPAATTAAPPADAKGAKVPSVIEIKSPNAEEEAKPATRAIKIVNPKERENEDRERKEKEEKERKEQEEKERQEREEADRIAKEAKEAEERRIREEEEARLAAEAAEKERILKEQEEKDRLEKERLEKERLEAERKAEEGRGRAQAEREAKEKAEQEAKEKAEKEAKEKAEQEAREKAEKAEKEAKEKAEQEAKEKAEQEAKEKAEADRLAALEAEKAAAEKSKQEKAETTARSKTDSAKSGLSIDLTRTASAPLPSPSPSARIEDFRAVNYPSHVQSPSTTTDAQGKFRYNRDFLMQFMNVCTDRPDSLPSLEVVGGDDRGMQSSGNNQRRSAPMSGARKPTPMGSFTTGGRGLNVSSPMGSRTQSNDDRVRTSRTPSESGFMPRNPLARPPSQRGSRGGKGRAGGQGRGDRGHPEPTPTTPLPDVAPLEKTENAWTPAVGASQAPVAINADEPISHEVVSRKVKGLLNKLTLEKFESISDKLVDIANMSAKENDGATLKLCIQIIFEKATDEPNFGSVYAKLCHKLHEKISEEVKDTSIAGSVGGKLFR
ncbi:hypothetical protein BGX31_001834, partial [Mortierella sp. GBA43]